MGLLDQLFAQQGYGLFGGNYPSTIFHQPEEAQAAREAAAERLSRKYRRGDQIGQIPQAVPLSPFDAGSVPGALLAGPGMFGMSPNAFAPTAPPVAAAPQAMTPPPAIAPAPVPQAADQPDSYINIGNYRMPVFGKPEDAAIPPNAQPTQGQLQPRQAPSFGAPSNGNFLDRVNAGFQSVGNGGSVLGALTGNYTDPLNTQRTNLTDQFNAYKQMGLSPEKALIATLNPKIAETWLTPKFEKVGPGENLVSVGGAGGSASTVASGGPEKPPAGYEYVDPKDPSKGLRGIPGGPATHLPAETAGRIAMMESAAAELPNARQILMKGRGATGTGAAGVASSYTNIGETGRAQRTVRTAIEGALRAMTGAAAPETEVRRYENMFMPGPFDSVETATQKLNQLEDFIGNAKRLVTQGRGPAGNQPPTRTGIRVYNPATGKIE